MALKLNVNKNDDEDSSVNTNPRGVSHIDMEIEKELSAKSSEKKSSGEKKMFADKRMNTIIGTVLAVVVIIIAGVTIWAML